ncbi:unnamed protein product [Diatraea saccharalis]|uniref:E3 ubiquitin-protein ligase n=1 Tax=Diatraea saccharalis TaxID=40085 RepID=A0A9N9WCP2_9NEOP|nr:unnamed protein product [Diatraea saccharalis]
MKLDRVLFSLKQVLYIYANCIVVMFVDGSSEWCVVARRPGTHPQPSTSAQVQVHNQQSDESIPVNESIISLLMKLHSQLSGKLDSFSLEEAPPETDEPIGDGPYFIGQVLRALAQLDVRCAAAIQHVRHSLWPNQRERQAEQRARERREKEERSRRARERQAAVMREFARRQQQFMSHVRAAAQHMEWDEDRAPPERHYDCVICNTTAPASHHDPIGLVALLQSTSVLGHRRRAGGAHARLALSEAERARLAQHHDTAAAAHHYRMHDDLHAHFDQESWLLSVNVGWEGGVHVASCGHHLHLRCLQLYLRALAAPQRPHNLHVDRGEFLCPVCRQLANTVLPRAPPPPPPPPTPAPAPAPATSDADQVRQMLATRAPPPVRTYSLAYERLSFKLESLDYI